MITPFDAGCVLQNLKDFQRRTVDHVFARMFDTTQPTRRFLVADEVGLGKTLVAKGVIARTVEHLQRQQQAHVNVVYVCSNAGIAAQNVARLTLPGQPAFSQATRLTLLPLVTAKLREHQVNFISFTPGTTFNQTSNSLGRKDERRLIYQMLSNLPSVSRNGLRNALRGNAGMEGWLEQADEQQDFDLEIASDYREYVLGNAELFADLQAVAETYHDRRRTLSEDDTTSRGVLIGKLRGALAKVCLGALKPDLVILDEFQRFSELFDDPEESPAAELADALFNYSEDLRVLLLSATPYRMYASDDEDEDHHQDFLRTIQFLMAGEDGRIETLKADLHEFRMGLLGVQNESDFEQLSVLKARIESTLRAVMCRTERVGTTLQADAMVKERVMLPQLTGSDLRDFRWLESVTERLDEPDTMEYWKSSPYLLNFMKEYSHKHALHKDVARRKSLVSDLVDQAGASLLSARQVEAYEPMDAGNPRLRTLMSEVDQQGLWRLLWLPPSMAYWQPQGAFKQVGSVTKHLVFSAWNVVPDALASVVSYEVERRIVAHSGITTDHASMPRRLAARLRFSRQGDRLAGMSSLMLMYPSRALVGLIDPEQLRMTEDGRSPSFAEVHQRAVELLAPQVEPLIDRAVEQGAVDRRWYWVALARLERAHAPASRFWCEYQWSDARIGADDAEHDVDSAFYAHMEQWLLAWDGSVDRLGRVPPDLLDVLARLALASPATCALRTLLRRWPDQGDAASSLLSASARIAEGLRSQFNSPRAVGLLKGQGDDDSYWERVLQYCADGNLQAMLDEYAHVLVESKSLSSRSPAEAVDELAHAMFEAMALRTASLRPDEFSTEEGRLKITPFPNGIRTHFALRYGGKSDDDKAAARKETVQAAFNSPFWPFVLISTSVGQEGLDFHTWCHSVIHWNLPSNPVDMEQREGRVHRYKGYAVRKNVAALYGEASLRDRRSNERDPWQRMFQLALLGRAPGSSDLVPFWICEHEGGASIERRVMLLPLSRDEALYQRLRRNLALYRMVFAQPRQEDLLACLERAIGLERAAAISARWSINLTPPAAAGPIVLPDHIPAILFTADGPPVSVLKVADVASHHFPGGVDSEGEGAVQPPL